jgi:hypothetical protein
MNDVEAPDATPFSRHQERPAWLILRVDNESMHRASLEEIDSMWDLYERACLQWPARKVELVRLWGRPVAVAVIVDGRLALTRTVGFTGEIRADFERLQHDNPSSDVRMVEVFGKRALRNEILAEQVPEITA